jgi:hypothetical protein
MSDSVMITGPIKGGAGTPKPFTAGVTGAQRTVDAHGRYMDTALGRNLYFAANSAGVTTSVGLATTYVGNVVSNPVGSGVNLVIYKVGWAWSVIAAAVNTIAIAVGYNPTTQVTHTTPLVVQSAFFTNSGVGGYAKADSSATLPTAPVYYMFIDNTPTATTNPKGGVIDLEGSIIIPPGGYIMTATTAASSGSAFWASIQWEEIPVNLV